MKINTAGTGKLFNMLEDEDDANIILVEDLSALARKVYENYSEAFIRLVKALK